MGSCPWVVAKLACHGATKRAPAKKGSVGPVIMGAGIGIGGMNGGGAIGRTGRGGGISGIGAASGPGPTTIA